MQDIKEVLEKLDVTTLSKNEMHCLTHMLGSKSPGSRNYFCSDLAGKDYETMKELEKKGLVKSSQPNKGLYRNSIFFYATEEGCRAIGLNSKQIKQALEN
jgi:hypothetical protein